MDVASIDADRLKVLEPVCLLSAPRLRELAAVARVETVERGLDPLRGRSAQGQTLYLLRGELLLTGLDGATALLVGGSGEARFPLRGRGQITGSRAITDIELLSFDSELLDVMATWDQLAAHDRAAAQQDKPVNPDWAILSGAFSVGNLREGAFARLPAAHIEALLERFERVTVAAGSVVVREGSEGDYYYVIETGRCRVERRVGGVEMRLAELKAGDTFGEEALVADAKRNATVTMITGGALLRLSKGDFIELLREPMLLRLSMDEALKRVASGAQWIDVRYPSEYQYDRLPGAINVPLAEIRNAFGVLDRDRDYIVYCQSGRRSSAAAFLLAQQGYRAFLLAGGLWGRGAADGKP